MIKRIVLTLLILALQIIPSSAIAGLFNRYEEKQPGQNLPVVTVPGRIIFYSNRGGVSDYKNEVWLLENGKLRELTQGSKVFEKGAYRSIWFKNPKWSPDGSEIMCLRDWKVVFIGLDGVIKRTLTTQKTPMNAVWAPSGRQIYYTAYTTEGEGAKKVSVANIYEYDLLNNQERQVTNFLMPSKGYRPIYGFAVSPDGETIAMITTPFSSDKDTNEGPFAAHMYTISTQGTDLKLLIKIARDPAWSPNGELLAYTAAGQQKDRDANAKIFVYDFKTQKSHQITKGIWEDRYPVFSPDGTKIVFSSGRHKFRVNGRELFIINIDGSGEARITPIQVNPNKRFENHWLYGWATDTDPDWAASALPE